MVICTECGEILHPNLFNAYRRELGIRKRKHYYNDFICYNCQESYLVEVDDGIAKSIVKLNLIGYTTKYCCEGHNTKDCLDGYVSFEDFNVNQFPSLPEGWETEHDMHKRLNYSLSAASSNIMRYDLRYDSPEDKAAVIHKAINNFNSWVDNLEPRFILDLE